MKVLMLTGGTRGDVQPLVALARALDQAGHEAVIASATQVSALAEDHGVRFVEIDEGPGRLTDSVAADRVGNHKLAAAKAIREATRLVRPMLEDAWEVAAEGADVVVHHPRVFAGPHVAEKLGVPAVLAAFAPVFLPTKAFPAPVFSGWMPPVLNRVTYQLTAAMTIPFRKAIDAWREETLGLPRRKGRHHLLPSPVLHAFSECLVPTPPDWPDSAVTTGFWLLPSSPAWQPPKHLAEFLDSDRRTVYVGFGSMAGENPRRTGAIVLNAIRQAGVRAVLSPGWGGLAADDLPKDVLMVDQVPHDWLFPQVDAVVHHGGAGTVAAAAASGRPQVICPFLGDQPFWARQARIAGIAPEPVPQRRLASDQLVRAIHEALGERADAAAKLGELIRAEDGTGNAVQELERLCRAGR